MKFLVFNVVVLAALGYLFLADRDALPPDLAAFKDRVGDKVAALTAPEAPKPVVAPAPVVAPEPVAAKPAPKPTATPPAPPKPVAEARPQAPAAGPPMPAVPAPKVVAETVAPAPRRLDPSQVSAKTAPSPLPPEVAQRRAEVMAGLDSDAPQPAAPAAAKGLALAEGDALMTPEQRRRELLSLAEDMELLYARSVSR